MAHAYLSSPIEHTSDNTEAPQSTPAANSDIATTHLFGDVDGPETCQVCVIGAGPSGLMLACNLTRYGVDVQVFDERQNKTAVGRADGLQPKSIETFRQMRLAGPLLQHGVKVYDISFWKCTLKNPLHRLGREVHYPRVIDVLDPYILLINQGSIEDLFIQDMKARDKEIHRTMAFDSYMPILTNAGNATLQISCTSTQTGKQHSVRSRYLVGCDGAHSKVRECIPGAESTSTSQPSIWGVLDGEIITDFPDIWTKTLVYSEEHGSVLIVPRERNMTRLYIELKACTPDDAPASLGDSLEHSVLTTQARKILAPFVIEWRCIEWLGKYQVGQQIASRFCDNSSSVFLAGDASHTHSPKSAQGMNAAMHDSWNLSWKLNLAVRGFARPELLDSYEDERRKVALDLVNFDYEQANQIAAGDALALARNYRVNARFIVDPFHDVVTYSTRALVMALKMPMC